MQKMLQRGFTLIELLVVIAIIGILAAVVLGSLNDARDNANDASAQTSINNIRNVAETIYSDNGFTYGHTDSAMNNAGTHSPTTDTGAAGTDVCANTEVQRLMTAASAQTRQVGTCVGTDNAYAVEVLLRNGNYYCVDSTGYAGQVGATAQLDANGNTATAEDTSCTS